MAGFSLVEILISLLLLSLILLGLDAMECYAMREQQAAYFLTVGVIALENMEGRLQVLKDNAGFDEQLRYWQQQINAILPDGQGAVQGTFPSYHISVCWHPLLIKSNCLHEDIQI